MKTWSWSVLLLVASAAALTHGFHVEAVTAQTGGAVDKPVGDVRIQERNIHLVLSKVANQYKVPIGIEVSAGDDLLNDGSITVRVKDGTLRDVLNAVVSQRPDYTWEVEDDVINVYPKGANRDPLLEAILAVKLKAFSIEEGTGRFGFRQDLVNSLEVSGVLEAKGVSVENEIFSKRDIAALGPGFSLKVSDVTVKSLLNRIIKGSETKYWIINRYGPNRQYLLLNL